MINAMKSLRNTAFALGVACMATGPALALTTEGRVALQTTLVDFIDARTIDGAFVFLDPRTKKDLHLHPAHLHPKIIPAGKIYFLCASFLDQAGQEVEVDFVARYVDGKPMIMQTLVDQRTIIRDVMSKRK